MKNIFKLIGITLLLIISFSCSKEDVNNDTSIGFTSSNETIVEEEQLTTDNNTLPNGKLTGVWDLIKECVGDNCQGLGATSFDFMKFNENNTVEIGRYSFPKDVKIYNFKLQGLNLVIYKYNSDGSSKVTYNTVVVLDNGDIIINEYICDKFSCDTSNIVKTYFLVKS